MFWHCFKSVSRWLLMIVILLVSERSLSNFFFGQFQSVRGEVKEEEGGVERKGGGRQEEGGRRKEEEGEGARRRKGGGRRRKGELGKSSQQTKEKKPVQKNASELTVWQAVV